MRQVFGLLVFSLGMLGILFGSAGRWDLPLVWAYAALLLVYAVVIGFCVMDPSLREEQRRPGPGGKDRSMGWLALPLIVAHWIIAGLDVGRFHWSDTMPIGFRWAGLGALAASLGLYTWALGVNPFFSPNVRVQEERGHHVITTGPYRYVRHPGYLGGLLSCVFGCLALGSWWATVPVGIMAFVLLRRVSMEDQFLRRELAGYARYAEQVRYRLLPGLW